MLTELQFHHHIRFGELHIQPNQPLVLLLGANGSGKSFLLSSCHPLAESQRIRKTYPFVPGETGFVRAVFQDRDLTWECIHELVPNSTGGHKCKSYLNQIRNGVKTELNPTGNNVTYRELIEKHLHFSRDVFSVGFLSYKNNGITSSAPSKRKEILETTIALETLQQMQKNATEQFREYNALIRVQENKKITLLQQGTIEQCQEQEEILQQKRQETLQQIESVQRLQQALQTKQQELQEDAQLDIRELSQLLQYSDHFDASKTPNDLVQEARNIQWKQTQCSEEIAKQEKQLQESLLDYESRTRIQQVEASLQEEERLLSQLQQQRNEFWRTEDTTELVQAVQTLQQHSRHWSTMPAHWNLEQNIQTIQELQSKAEKRKQFFQTYQLYESMDDGNLYQWKFGDNCNSCDLYRKFGVAQEFVREKRDQYVREVALEVEEREELMLRQAWQQSVESVEKARKTIQYSVVWNRELPMHTNQDFFDLCHQQNVESRMSQIFARQEDILGQCRVLEVSCAEKRKEVQTRKELCRDTEITQERIQELRDQLQTKRQQLQDMVQQYQSLLSWYETNQRIASKYPQTIAWIREKEQQFQSLRQQRQQVLQELEANRRHKEQLDTELDRQNLRIFQYQHQQQELASLQKELVGYTDTKQCLSRCRELLEKSIPVLLLEQNLQFIETMTNRMLEENGIDIQIEIVPSEQQIDIPVIVQGKSLEDIDMLSTGEQCLISLMMNACILHILGYSIFCLDEIDANLDVKNREKFNNVLYSILANLDIEQIICISHNVGSTIQDAKKYCIGDPSGLDLPENECIVI